MQKVFKPFSVLFLLALVSPLGSTQELNCVVTVNYESIPTTHRDFLLDFADVVREYINDYRWTDEDFGEDRIRCTLNIFFLSVTGDDQYSAQVFVGSQRPIHETNQSTGVVRIFDDKWDFTYNENQTFYHDLFQFEPLASFLDFYAYVILGYDYDTYEPMAGTPFFEKALDVVRLGQSGSGSRGWNRARAGVYSRADLIDELLNAKYQLFRDALFTYHTEGLDLLRSKPTEAQKNIAQVIEDLSKIRKQSTERSVALKTFFDTKYQEIAEVLAGYPDKSVFEKLGEIDPTHQSTYQVYKDKEP